MLARNTYRDRTQAGGVLANHLAGLAGDPNVLILALPRGGVPVALEVARRLQVPMDIFLVRKLGLPQHEETAMGAIASGGIQILNQALIEEVGVTQRQIDAIALQETEELTRRETEYRAGRAVESVSGRTVVLVDDGVATGFSIRAAMIAVQRLQPAHLVVAVPVGPPDTCAELAESADAVVCPLQPSPFHAVGVWYDHFEQVPDAAVRDSLRELDAFRHASR